MEKECMCKWELGDSILARDTHRNMITVAEIRNKSYQTACGQDNVLQVTDHKTCCIKHLRLL